MSTEKNGPGGPVESRRSHRVNQPYHDGPFPPATNGDDSRLSRIDRQHGTGRFYNDIERAVHLADMAAKAHLRALADGDPEMAAATHRRFLDYSAQATRLTSLHGRN